MNVYSKFHVYSVKFNHDVTKENVEIFVVASSPETALSLTKDHLKGYVHEWSLTSLFCLMPISAVEI